MNTEACTDWDVTAAQAAGGGNTNNSFPWLCADCSLLSWTLSKGFQEKSFASCLSRKLNISIECSMCFAGASKYQYKNCKSQCLPHFCSSFCLGCKTPYASTLERCTGRYNDKFPQCVKSVVSTINSSEDADIETINAELDESDDFMGTLMVNWWKYLGATLLLVIIGGTIVFKCIKRRRRMMYSSLSMIDARQNELDALDDFTISSEVMCLRESIELACNAESPLFSSSGEDLELVRMYS